MPYGDGTGPGGMGPQTGRGFGYCSGYSHPGNAVGRGFGGGRYSRSGRFFGPGMARGAGFGRYREYGVPLRDEPSPEEEKAQLNTQIATLEKTVARLKERVEEIDGKK